MLRVLFKTKIICLKVLKAYFDIQVVTTVNPATKVNLTKSPATKVNSNKNKNKMLRVLFETQKIITQISNKAGGGICNSVLALAKIKCDIDRSLKLPTLVSAWVEFTMVTGFWVEITPVAGFLVEFTLVEVSLVGITQICKETVKSKALKTTLVTLVTA